MNRYKYNSDFTRPPMPEVRVGSHWRYKNNHNVLMFVNGETSDGKYYCNSPSNHVLSWGHASGGYIDPPFTADFIITNFELVNPQ